ncbi:MAG: nucleotidyltransferase family protein [Bacteroidota bacterium]
MLNQTDILHFLKRNKQTLRQVYGVERIGLFGSYARANPHADSDIDLLVTFSQQDFMLWSGLLNYLQQSLGCKVDLITEGSHMTAGFIKQVEKEIIYA